jgi:uncharacterized membrane protein
MAKGTLRGLLTGVSVAWAALLPVAPIAASQPAPAPFWYAFAFLLYGAGGLVCHQLPARSFYIGVAQMPVCARCTGIYLGVAAIAFLVALRPAIARTRRREHVRMLLVAAVLPTVVTLIYEWSTGHTPSNAIRAVAGAPLGAAAAFVVMSAVG